MRRVPRLPIGFHVDQIPRGQRKSIEVALDCTRRILAKGTITQVRETGNVTTWLALREFEKRLLYFANQHRAETCLQVSGSAIRCVVSVRHDVDSGFNRQPGHGERKFPAVPKTHLRKKVKIVFAHGYQVRLPLAQDVAKSLARRSQRRIEQGWIEQGHADAMFPQDGGGQKCLQRRIRLHLRGLLYVRPDVVAVSKKDSAHG